MTIKQNLQDSLRSAVQAVYGEAIEEAVIIKTPPTIEMGDFAIGCFSLAKQFKKTPVDIAKELVNELNKIDIAAFEAVGPYINVRLEGNDLFNKVCKESLKPFPKNGKTVMVEYLSPNTNKPLHLGHMRNGVTGMAMSSILDFAGFKVVKANLVNDRGIHICKSMLAWKKFANGATPESEGKKGDHFVGDYYVLFSQKVKDDPKLLDEAQELLKAWEEGEPEAIKLWEMMNTWVYSGFAETYKTLGFEFDVEYHESNIYKTGKDIVNEGLAKGIFQKGPTGSVSFMLPQEEFSLNEDGSPSRVTLLRDNGTSVYATQDIAVAVKKAADCDFDVSVYVVGEEQEYYFKTLFSVLKALGYPWADKCYHLSYGMVELPDGKMKSREGNVVDADDLAKEVADLVVAEIKEKHGDSLADQEIAERSAKIGLGAIKFYLLNTSPKNKLIFDPKKSISFDGATGPYTQYAYARAMNILEKAKKEGVPIGENDFSFLGSNPEEHLLIQNISLFPERIQKAAATYNPSVVTDAVYKLAKAFHQFYNKQQVVTEDREIASQRLALVVATAETIKTGLNLLGIETLENM
jgi:arginyl-tRNA synthetase